MCMFSKFMMPSHCSERIKILLNCYEERVSQLLNEVCNYRFHLIEVFTESEYPR